MFECPVMLCFWYPGGVKPICCFGIWICYFLKRLRDNFFINALNRIISIWRHKLFTTGLFLVLYVFETGANFLKHHFVNALADVRRVEKSK